MATPGRDSCSRIGQTRRGQFRRQPHQVGKAGRKAHAGDQVLRRGVPRDDLARRETERRRNVIQVRSEHPPYATGIVTARPSTAAASAASAASRRIAA